MCLGVAERLLRIHTHARACPKVSGLTAAHCNNKHLPARYDGPNYARSPARHHPDLNSRIATWPAGASRRARAVCCLCSCGIEERQSSSQGSGQTKAVAAVARHHALMWHARTKVEVDEVLGLVGHVRACRGGAWHWHVQWWWRSSMLMPCASHGTSCRPRRACTLGQRAPKLRPTMQCHVGLYFLSNSFLMKAAMSFSMLNFSRACAGAGEAGA